MAYNLTPVASSVIDYHASPTLEPPHTEFPYPELKQHDETPRPTRLDSESTLAGDDDTLEKIQKRRSRGQNLPATPGPRPVLANKRYETEAIRPVATRPILPLENRRSTGGHPSDESHPLQSSSGSEASSEDEEEEEEEEEGEDDEHDDDDHPRHWKRTQTHPAPRDLGPAYLNRARMRPGNEQRRKRHALGGGNFLTKGKIAKDGRLNIKVSETAQTGYLAKALGSALRSHLHPHAVKARQDADELKARYLANKDHVKIPRMNIVIMVIGSRGDIQPFLKIGRILKDKYGHRVRIATHPAFRKFVQDDIGLEFFSVGGDPSELMSFMVKNPGLVPSFDTLTSGEVGRRREQMFEMFQGFWRACINTTDDETDTANLQMLGSRFPFVADAIIANPPSFAHFHCAERLSIPLHLVFTFPYSPTQAFPHPLANIKSSNVDREYTNYMSYPLVDLMTWQGLGDLINRFRVKTLGLEPVSTLWAPGQLTRLKVPMTYLWSPGLVPKPEDWGPEIDIAGYVFLDLASSYKPSKELEKFLERSEDDPRPIIYIGFGSISGIDDPKAFCELIFKATVKAGVKAIVSRGWGGMGDGMDVPDGVFMIDNVPHDWLFPKLDAVVHHGGAGTTAAGLKLGKPTMIVPFFGDQPFWAAMIVRAGAGAKEVWPLKKLSVDRFAEGIRQCLSPEAKENAQAIAKSIEAEGDGAENAVDSFHRSLNLDGRHSMRCGVCEDRVAVWKLKHTGFRLSALAAEVLVEHKQITWSDLDLVRNKHWSDFQGPGEPITGAGGVVMAAFQEAFHGISSISEMTREDLKRIDKHKRKGKTVADAITLPGVVAQHTRHMSMEQAQEEREKCTPVNLTGDAEPIRLPSVAGLAADRDEAIRPCADRTDTTSTDPGPTPVVLVKDVGKGVGHSFKAISLMPLELLNAITLGFRNAPRLYGDKTVRPPPQAIKGLRQGLKVAGQELWFGTVDGVTGLIQIPYLDVKEDGIASLPKGMARGLGGVALKPIAGAMGVVNYTLRGCYMSIYKRVRDTKKLERWLRRTRIRQGEGEVRELREAGRKQQEIGRFAPRSRTDQPLQETQTRVLQKWSTHERDEFEAARARSKSTGSALGQKLSVTPRASTV